MNDTGASESPIKPFRRHVFYVPGYDPIHPRRYRELFRSEGAEQARISGYSLALQPKTTKGGYGWRVQSVIHERQTEATVEVLVWSDIVRQSMSNSIPATYAQLVRTAWAYIGSGALFRLMRLRKGPVIAALYPIVFLIVQLLLAVTIAAVGWWVTKASVTALITFGRGIIEAAAMDRATFPFESLMIMAIAAAVSAMLFMASLNWFKARDGKVFAYYLMHDYAYSARYGGANPPELEVRMAEFGEKIRTALTSDVDEVLVVGHSSGAHLSVSILSDLIRRGLPAHAPKLSFLSLGQVVPMVSFLPKARRLRGDLAYLSTRDELTWVDVTAPGDGCAFALCDPVKVTGVAPKDQKWPLVLSAAFTQTLSPERWKSLRWKFFRLHFQYLCAFDRPGDYDYFQITAGPVTLAERYKSRPPSRSRIDRAANRYTDTA